VVELSPLATALYSVAMAGAGLLIWQGVRLFRRGDKQKGVLMVVCAAVVVMNVMIWTV
jgi:predicted permease